MTHEISQDTPTGRGRTEPTCISCPGCGRHDYVLWPAGEPVFRWTCFNCRGTFELSHKSGH